ncbi:hypothetical protein FBU31_005670, partial [Coemansia sp. 'formosensis']
LPVCHSAGSSAPERHEDDDEGYAHYVQIHRGCRHGAHTLYVWPPIHRHDLHAHAV